MNETRLKTYQGSMCVHGGITLERLKNKINIKEMTKHNDVIMYGRLRAAAVAAAETTVSKQTNKPR